MKQIVIAVGILIASGLSLRAADEVNTNEPSASDLLAAGLSRATRENKVVFLVFGSPTCSWCKRLDKFHIDPEVSSVTDKYLILLRVDMVENAGGHEMYLEYGTERGVPAWSILSAEGQVLADSKDGEENIGFPYKPQEVAHYLEALKKACPNLTDIETELLADKLKAIRALVEEEHAARTPPPK